MRRTVFLDRDGVINRKPPDGGYVTRWEDLEILPGVAEAVALLNRSGFAVVIVSNQRCVAKGLITASELEDLHRRLLGELAAAGARIDAIYYCPHENDFGCDCRKPAPGMLLAAARDHSIDLSNSWMIGDSERDIRAGQTAGCRTIHLAPQSQARRPSARLSENPQSRETTASSLLEAVRKILQQQS